MRHEAAQVSNGSVAAVDAYTVAVRVTVSFPAVMLGQLSVQAYGTDEQGHAGPMTEVTKFTVTGVPMPALMSAGSSGFLVAPYQWTMETQPVALVNGAAGPVTVSGTQVLYPQYCPGYLVGPQAYMTGAQSAQVNSSGWLPYSSCVFATYYLSAPGLAPVLNAVYYGAALNPYFNIGVQQVLYSVPQGGSVTVPVTFTPAMGYAGPVQLGVYAPSGIAPTWDVSGVTLDGTNAGSGNLTLAVDPGLARGTYAVMIPGGTYAGNSGYFFVTVTPNTVPDFVLSSITPVSVAAGQAVAFSARVVPVAGFGGAVTVSSPGVAGAVGLTFAPNTTGALTAAGAAVTGTVATFASTPSCPQPYVVPVTAVSGGITHSGTVSVMVHGGPAPGFTVSGPPGLLTVTQGTTGSVGVTITSSACFSGAATYSAASVAGVAMAAPANGSVTVNGTGSVVAGFTFFAPMGMPAGTYSGTATVTIAGISQTATFSVKVVPPTTPGYTITPFSGAPAMPGGNVTTSLVPGGSTTLYVVVQPQNGYTGVPVFSVNPAFLPPGITVTFSDGGKATYGTATATITASNTVAANTTITIPIDSTDGSQHVSIPVGLKVGWAPLTLTHSISYTKFDWTTKRAAAAVLTPRILGGSGTYTVSGLGVGPNSGNTFTTNGAADVTGTLVVTDSTTGVVAQVAATIPASPVLPGWLQASMAMKRIAALENFAGQVVAAGRSDVLMRSAFLSAAGVSASDYVGLKNTAMAYKSAQATVKLGAGMALKPLLLAGYLPETAGSVPLATNLRGYYAQGAGLAASWGAQFNGLSGAGAMVSSLIGPGGGGPTIWFPGSCSDTSLCPELVVDGTVMVDPGSGQVSGSAYAQLNGVPAVTQSYGSVEVDVNATLIGPGGWLDGASASAGGTATRVDVSLSGWATSQGQYTVSGFGSGTVEDGSLNSFYFYRSQPFTRSMGWNGPTCAGPVVGSVQVYSGGSALPQPTNGLLVGDSGTIQVVGGCLDSSLQLLVTVVDPNSDDGSGPGITLGPVSVAPGGYSAQAVFTVSPDAGSGPRMLYVTTGAGSVSTQLMVQSDYPYIDSVDPVTWLPGTTTLVTITGAGFGGGFGGTAGTLTITPTDPTNPVTFSVASWSDGQITGYVTTSAGDPGQMVAISVFGGSYGAAFRPNGGQGRSSTANAAVAARVCGDTRDLLRAEYYIPTYKITLRPSCEDFTQQSTSVNFRFAQRDVAKGATNYLNWGTYSWAIIRDYFVASLDALIAAKPPNALVMVSGYRNPVYSWNVAVKYSGKGTVNSPHPYGYAADLNTDRSDLKWTQLHDFIRKTPVPGGFSCIEPMNGPGVHSTNSHVHVDWRPYADCADRFRD